MALRRKDLTKPIAKGRAQIPGLAGLFGDDQGRHAPPPYAIPCDSLPRSREHPEEMQVAGAARIAFRACDLATVTHSATCVERFRRGCMSRGSPRRPACPGSV